jgi:AcrR family transcriptional regulator
MNSTAAPTEGQPLDLTLPNARPSEPAPKSQTRTRLEVEQRRAQLLTLGQELFSSSTYDELSIDDIARAAGISKGLLYHYFPSKRDYYVATIRVAAGELLHQTDTVAESSVLDWIDHNDVAREDLQELLVRSLEHIVVDLGAQSPMSAGVSSS